MTNEPFVIDRLRAEVAALINMNIAGPDDMNTAVWLGKGWRIESAITGTEYFETEAEAIARVRELAGLDQGGDK